MVNSATDVREPVPEPGRVLIIDDEPADLTLSGVLLLQAAPGARIAKAADLDTALDVLHAGPVDCVLLDYHLGSITAPDAIPLIRQHGGGRPVPIIVLSGAGDDAKAAEALKAGAHDYINKNRMTSEALARAIANSMQKARLEYTLALERQNLEEANVALTKQSREIQSFYHTVSHELKTPITAIREFSSLMADGVLGEVTEPQADALATTLECCDRLTRLVNDLFDAARIETGKMALELAEVDLADLVRGNVELMRTRASEKGLSLGCEVVSDLPVARVDPNRLGQVLCNLIGNAIKFTEAGGCVQVRAENDAGGQVLVSVKDNGVGISAEHAELIFDRLYQAEDEDSAAHTGMGIGLYLCKQIVNLHGGAIAVDSTPGVGSMFTFSLPRSVYAD